MEICFHQSEAGLGSNASSVCNFYPRFSDVISGWGPVVASRNVGCFVRLLLHLIWICNWNWNWNWNWNFYPRPFLRRHIVRIPVVTSRNVGCFLRLILQLIWICNYNCNLFTTEHLGVLKNSLTRSHAFQIELDLEVSAFKEKFARVAIFVVA